MSRPSVATWRDHIHRGNVTESRRYLLVMGTLVIGLTAVHWTLAKDPLRPPWVDPVFGGIGIALFAVYFWSAVRPALALRIAAIVMVVAICAGTIARGAEGYAAAWGYVCLLLPVLYGLVSARRLRDARSDESAEQVIRLPK